MPSRIHLATLDRDPGFTHVLGRRLGALGWDHRVLSNAATVDALVAMRLSALVVNPTVVGADWPDYLERICSRLPSLAVIVCAGPSSTAQRVRALRLGVDAWITKPCHPEELVCVVEAVLRRHRQAELPSLDISRTIGELTIRHDLHQVYAGKLSLELTVREFQILDLLARSERVMAREEIYERVWGYAMAHGDRSVDVFVRKLRQKLGAASPSWTYIHTHFGVGYRFGPQQEVEPSHGPVASTGEAPEPERRTLAR